MMKLLRSQTWRYNSPELVFESTVSCLQWNLMLHIVLIHLGSISLRDKPVNPLNSCEIHIALSFSCFIMYVTVPAHLDEQLAHFRCVYGKILNVLLKLHLSKSTTEIWGATWGTAAVKNIQTKQAQPIFLHDKDADVERISYLHQILTTFLNASVCSTHKQRSAHDFSHCHFWYWQPGKPWHSNTTPFPL